MSCGEVRVSVDICYRVERTQWPSSESEQLAQCGDRNVRE